MTDIGRHSLTEPSPLRRRFLGNEEGATTLEWALLLGAIAIPAYLVLTTALNIMLAYYQMMTTLNALPFP